MSYDIQSVKDKLAQMGVSPKKSLGQNFLIYKGTIEKIIAAVPSEDVEEIIEIGPGLGALTYLLKDLDKKLTLIELDNAFSAEWIEQGFNVIHKDALKVDWKNEFTKPTTLVSNLPYQISSSLVIDMSVLEVPITSMVLMFQKEVAGRIMAKHGSKAYGLLSVIAQVFWQVELVLEAGPKDFYPPPSIASQVLRFTRKDSPIENKKDFLRMVKSAFGQRRKKVINNLKAYSSCVDWKAVWAELGWDEKIRAEDISVEGFVKLHKALQ